MDKLEAAANRLHYLCIDAAEAVIKNNCWARLGIHGKAIPAILRSWERDDFSLYGRFDLSYDGYTPPKLLEYNADTPTALVEASVAQWFWLQDINPAADQFNSTHERLIDAWKRFRTTNAPQTPTIHFSSVKDIAEDEMTVLYLRDTCEQAGFHAKTTSIEDIGWSRSEKIFVDNDNEHISHVFKLYPWECLWQDEFCAHLAEDRAQYLEPAWKMLLSNNGLLPILWELYPEHHNLLPAYETPAPLTIGTQGIHNGKIYKITAYNLVEIATTTTIWERYEYELTANDGSTALLICGEYPGDKAWTWLDANTPRYAPEGTQAATLKVNDLAPVDENTWRVTQLLRTTPLSRQERTGLAYIESTPLYGYRAISNTEILLVRWNESHIAYHRGGSVLANTIREQFF